jgi:hypothetical protein
VLSEAGAGNEVAGVVGFKPPSGGIKIREGRIMAFAFEMAVLVQGPPNCEEIARSFLTGLDL